MVRVLFFNAFFFVLPFLLYGGWLAVVRGTGASSTDWSGRIILWLALGGVVLMAIAIVAFGTFHAAPPGGSYKPAIIEDGRIVPGHID